MNEERRRCRSAPLPELRWKRPPGLPQLPLPSVPAGAFRRGQPAWTELFFEYSAMVVLREPSEPQRLHEAGP
jgi:hypothetical protein